MASITGTNLTSGSTISDATSFATASVTLPANKLILLSFRCDKSGAFSGDPTASGASRTWTKITSLNSVVDQRKLIVFRSLSGSENSGAITITSAGGDTYQRASWSIDTFDNVVTTGTNGADAVVQSAIVAGSGTITSLTVTLSAFAKSNNATFGSIGGNHDNVANITVGSGFTQLGSSAAGPEGGTILKTEYKQTPDTSVDWTLTSDGNAPIAFGCELNNSSPPGTASFLTNFL